MTRLSKLKTLFCVHSYQIVEAYSWGKWEPEYCGFFPMFVGYTRKVKAKVRCKKCGHVCIRKNYVQEMGIRLSQRLTCELFIHPDYLTPLNFQQRNWVVSFNRGNKK